jgi:KDO2-lipid IV(A) lauroyltransferase
MQVFPLEFHYLVSDLLFFLIYHAAGYRKTVVRKNLQNAFPEKELTEILAIEKKFYRGFADMFIETLYFTHTWKKRDKKRLILENIDLFYDNVSQGRNVIVVCGHFGNWEFMQLFQNKIEEKTFFVYKKLNNKAFDQFYRDLRARVAQALEMSETYRKLISETNKGRAWGALFISDQRPLPNDLKNWVTFLNQDTPVMTGTERIAKKTNAVIIYLEVKRIKRGYHKAYFEELLSEPRNTIPLEITTIFMKRLEKSINESPEQYLWTHKRWKFKK